MKINICGIEIDRYSLDQVIEKIIDQAKSRHAPDYAPGYVVTPNAQHIVMLQNDARFRQIYQQAALTVPDGVSLLWAAQFLGTPLLGRVNGTDLFEQLCRASAEAGLKVFLLGGRPGAATGAAEVLSARHPQLQIVGTYCPPYGFESDATERERIQAAVAAATPDILFVGLGAPKQEYWIYEHYQQLNIPISIGIGVSFEFVSGTVQRAPKLLQKLGLEWAFRLVTEPKRLWRRYVFGNTSFTWLVLKQKLTLNLS
jgi:N-acetylglucosaminyldiphosphoundecaprenol N-acetyl-beta-D-mannosaminyltransferase